MKHFLLILLSAVISASAFANSPAALPDFELCARYSVWLDKNQKQLQPFNDYFIKNYRIDRSVEGQEKMIFSLPRDLTAGQKVEMSLTVVSHKDGHREFEGESGRASCDGPWKKMTCNFHFNPIAYDEAASFKFLTRKYGETAKRDGLVQIAMRFGGDPIGVAVMAPRDARCFQPRER